jgi:hypothetical protein
MKWLVTARIATVIALALALASLAAGAAGCKQGIGERCQQDSDCSSGVCSKSDPRICQGNGSGVDTTQIDAEPPPDTTAPPPASAAP